MKTNKQDWHPADIRAALEKKVQTCAKYQGARGWRLTP